MKFKLIFILLCIATATTAQQYTYQIQPKDSTFTLDVITTFNSSREGIER